MPGLLRIATALCFFGTGRSYAAIWSMPYGGYKTADRIGDLLRGV